ncbi:MAG: hypothetical protein IK100_09655 [Muribaculaceae bacterium]|nr:hypothetical protein [Muribaculaceae bacterium]
MAGFDVRKKGGDVMRRTALLIALFALSCLASFADYYTWNYEENFAKVMSHRNCSIKNGELDETALLLALYYTPDIKTLCLIQIAGNNVAFDFTDKRNYIVVQKTVISEKIKFTVFPHPRGRKDVVMVKDAERFIKLLKSTDQLHISLPVCGKGTETFDFYFGDYPLEWEY